MAIEFACSCGKTLSFAQAHAGRQIICPECGTVQTVPGHSTAVSPATGATPKRARARRKGPSPLKIVLIVIASLLLLFGLSVLRSWQRQREQEERAAYYKEILKQHGRDMDKLLPE